MAMWALTGPGLASKSTLCLGLQSSVFVTLFSFFATLSEKKSLYHVKKVGTVNLQSKGFQGTASIFPMD